jgi:hypothetical protein
MTPSTADGSAGIEAEPGEQVRPAGRLAGRARRVVRRRQRGIGRRVPDVLVEPVEDPGEPVAARHQVPIEAHPGGREQDFARIRGAHRVDGLGAPDPLAQEVDPPPVADRRARRTQPQLVGLVARRPPVIGQVVDRQRDRRTPDDRVVRVGHVAQERDRARVPVVDRDDVDRALLGTPRLQGGTCEQREPPRVVGIVARGIAVEARPIVGRRVVHQPEAISVRVEGADRHVRHPAGCQRIRHADVQVGDHRRRGHLDAAIARQEDLHGAVDRTRDPSQRPRQGIDDIAEPAGLGPRLALRGDEDHLHGAGW